MTRLARAAAIAIAALALHATVATAATPSLRLISADGSVTVSRDELRGGSMHLGLWVAADGGEFRISARRPGYGRWEAAQVDAQTGAALRSVPAGLIDGANGFRRFVDVRVLTRSGRRVARRSMSFCPGQFERVSPDGPPNPSHYGGCGSGFPFVRGVVWGIDRGWASALGGGLMFGRRPSIRPLRLRPGRYRVVARIAAAYRRLFEIPAGKAEARLALRVTPGFRRGRGGPLPPGVSEVEIVRTPAARAAAPDPATMPDLVALPPWDVGVQRTRNRRELLRFAGTPWNAGPAPMIVEGFRRPGRRSMDAQQAFVDADGNVVGGAPAGKMEYHGTRGHHHWHFLQFVAYRLVRPGGGRAVRARKQSFCLVSTDAVDMTVPGAELIPDVVGLGGSACGDERSIWLRQTLPAGWGDTYGAGTAGQSFDITGLPNGAYILEMRVNPLGQLHETTTANNVARRRVVLSGDGRNRRARMAAWHGIRR